MTGKQEKPLEEIERLLDECADINIALARLFLTDELENCREGLCELGRGIDCRLARLVNLAHDAVEEGKEEKAPKLVS